MRNVMYEVPSVDGVSACTVTKETVAEKKDPVLSWEKKKNGKRILNSKEALA